jgi:hypothetical protein
MKNRLIILIIFIVFFSFYSSAITPINLSGRITIAQSPYNIDGYAVVPAGQTLIIDPGVELRFKIGNQGILHVKGKIIAQGTASNRIKFTHNGSGTSHWGCILLDKTMDKSSVIEYCTIEYGGTASDIPGYASVLGAFANYSENFKIKNCDFLNSERCITGNAITEFIECRFENLWNVSTFLSNDLILNKCIIKNCEYGMNVSGGQIYANNCVFDNIKNYALRGELKINNCTFLNCWSIFDPYLGSVINNSVFYKNTDIYLSNCSIPVNNCLFDNILYSLKFTNTINCLFGYDPLLLADYKLSFNSPCINTGNYDNVSATIGTSDLFGNNRVNFNQIDIGATEFSDENFITIIDPAPNHSLYGGSILKTAWKSNFTNVKIEFSADGGLNWDEIATQVLNSNIFEFKTPSIDSKTCLIRITSNQNPSFFDISDPFTLFQRIIPNQAILSGTLKKEFSPYIIEGIAYVPKDSSLTIEPGVEIRLKSGEACSYCNDGYHYPFGNLSIEGNFTANGTIDEPILFTRNGDTGGWDNISINNTGTSHFKNCIIKYSLYSAIRLNNGNTNLLNCRISENIGTGIYCNAGNLNCSQCIIEKNKNYGIVASSKSNLNIINCNIIENNSDVSFWDPSISSQPIVRIYNSIIANNTNSRINQSKGDISFKNCFLPSDCTFADSSIIGSDPGYENFNAILYNSKCINRGTSTLPEGLLPLTDFNGNERIINGKIDIGAVEFQGTEYVNLKTPSNFTSWQGGTKHIIEWSSSKDSVSLEYSIDDGTSWMPIADVTDTTRYEWDVPMVESSNCRIKVKNQHSDLFDISDIAFSIFISNIPDKTELYGTLTLEHSPYKINGLATVPFERTLTIEPGVRLEFIPSTTLPSGKVVGNLLVKGELSAKGTKERPIVFTRQGLSGKWNSITLKNKTLCIEYCKIEYGSNSLIADTSELILSKCTINNNSTGITSNNCDVKIIASRFTENGEAIRLNGSTCAIIGCVIDKNINGMYIESNSLDIYNSDFINNSSYGILSISSSNGMNIFNSIFYGNAIGSFQINYPYAKLGAVSNCLFQESSIDGFNIGTKTENLLGINPELNLDFSLKINSPCINKGANVSTEIIGHKDILEFPRVKDNVIDIGATEFQGEIYPDLLTILSPQIHVQWRGGYTNEIKWNGGTNLVRLEYYNGKSWIIIQDSIPNSGIFKWITPEIDVPECKIRITDCEFSGLTDMSDSTFLLFSRKIPDNTHLDGVLYERLSPYYFEGKVYISPDDTLTIEPGVTINLKSVKPGNYSDKVGDIEVSGKLIVKGTPEKKIVFTHLAEGTYWGGISYDNYYPYNIELSNFRIEYGSKATIDVSQNAALLFQFGNSKITISDGEISNSYGDGIWHRTFGKLIINRCLFKNNKGNALWIDQMNAKVFNSVFDGNRYGIRNDSYFGEVVNCTFYKNNSAFDNEENIKVYNSIFNKNGNFCNFNGSYKNCLFDMVAITGDFQNCLWDMDANITTDYNLLYNSPCVNSGVTVPLSDTIGNYDFYGNSRIINGKIDIGATEYAGSNTIALLTPKSVNYRGGTIDTIKWVGGTGNIKLEYSGDGGLSWTTIASSSPNAGVYYWTTPYQDIENCILRITDLNIPSHIDLSDNPFAIYVSIIPDGTKLDGTLKYEDSPFYFKGKVTVLSQKVLTIEPGVTIRFKTTDYDDDTSYGNLTVYGQLIAKGTSDKKITFTRYSETGYWGGIILRRDMYYAHPENGYSHFTYCLVEYARDQGLSDELSLEELSNSEFRFNKVIGLFIETIKKINISNLYVHDNGYYGIELYNRFCAVLNNSLIVNNLRTGIFSNFIESSGSIINCTIARNGSYGISYGGGILSLTNNIISNNKIGGINHRYADSLIIKNSLLQDSISPYYTYLGNNIFEKNAILNSDYSLSNISPALNAGTTENIESFIGSYDINGKPRISFGQIDIGACEYSDKTLTSINLTNNKTDENLPVGQYIGTLIFNGISDQDSVGITTINEFDNFQIKNINGKYELFSKSSFDFEDKNSYHLVVDATYGYHLLNSRQFSFEVTISDKNDPPVAVAGPDQHVPEGSLVKLDGSLSNDREKDKLTFNWSTNGPISFSSATAGNPTLIAPSVPEDMQFLIFLQVNDGLNKSLVDTLILIVKDTCMQNTLCIYEKTIPIDSSICFDAYDSISVAGYGSHVIFQSSSSVELIAGQSIRFLPGFHAKEGSYAYAHITSDSTFCDGASESSIVEQPQEKSVKEETQSEEEGFVPMEKSIKIYPNPTTGRFTVELINFDNVAKVCLYNSTGAKVFQSESNSSSQEIDVHGLRKGIYFVRISNGKEQFTKKLVVN